MQKKQFFCWNGSYNGIFPQCDTSYIIRFRSTILNQHSLIVPTGADQVSSWLNSFEVALTACDHAGLASLFDDDCHWRDLLALTWNITPRRGREAIAEGLAKAQPSARASNFRIAVGHREPRLVTRLGLEVIEAIFAFDTELGRGLGVVRLLASHPEKAFALMTSLQELNGHEERVGARRPSGDAYSRNFGGENWSDLRAAQGAYAERDPAVLVVGAGHAGLSTAAKLRMLGVDTLTIDAKPRVGDVWRDRYHSLALHNQTTTNHLPYLPFPPHWPQYLPKDMVGGWLETYAWAMECNVWTSTLLIGGHFDEAKGIWNAQLRRADGSERTIHPRHIVFANGIVGGPVRPSLPGLDAFRGEVMHTHDYKNGKAWRGKRALVLGTGTSAHDVAQDLHESGANVKMLQRGSTTVVSVKSAALNQTLYHAEDLSVEDADLISSLATNELLVRGFKITTKRMMAMDHDLIEGLKARGFKIDFGNDLSGHQVKLRQRFGGYYLNCGASELIVNGAIGLLQWSDVDHFVAEGVLMKDGRTESADLIVLATGYETEQEYIRRLMGSEIADKIGPVWGMDKDEELANMFKPTPQKGLWFIGGGFSHSRIYSHYLGLQIKARELGLID
jgi:putative flavoprotein involved in K+ transport